MGYWGNEMCLPSPPGLETRYILAERFCRMRGGEERGRRVEVNYHLYGIL
jgi:hypothetical protein